MFVIKEVANKYVNANLNYPIFYKFEIEQKKSNAVIEEHSLMTEERAKNMATSIIAKKIASSMTFKEEITDNFFHKYSLCFSYKYFTLEDEELLKKDIEILSEENNKLMTISIDQEEKIITQNNKIKNLKRVLIISGISILLLGISHLF